MKKNLLSFVLMFLTISIYAQDEIFEWAKSIGAIGADIAYSSAIDSEGNIIIVGSYEETVDFDPGAGEYLLNSAGSTDIFVLKLNSDGEFIWVKGFGGSLDDIARNVTIDNDNNIYVTGCSTYTTTKDVFIYKLDADGNTIFTKKLTGDSDNLALNVKTKNNNIYISGYFTGTTDFNPGTGNYEVTSAGDKDIFILKLTGEGNFIWAKTYGGIGQDIANALCLDDNNNLYIVGDFQDTVDFNPSSTTSGLTISDDNDDMFLLKLDSAGDFQWIEKFGGSGSGIAYDVKIDNLNNIIIGGWFSYSTDFDPGAANYILTSANDYDMFLLKLNQFGSFVWAKSMGGGLADRIRSIAIDNENNIYATGYFSKFFDFDPGTEETVLHSAGEYDFFNLKFTTNGNLLFANSYGATHNDVGLYTVLDNNNNSIYTVGSFADTVDFNPSDDSLKLISFGENDIFIQKFSVSTTNIKENTNPDFNVKIFPNPAKNRFIVNSDEIINKITITDIHGKIVFSKNNLKTNNYYINLNQINGAYYIQIVTDKNIIIKKLIINK